MRLDEGRWKLLSRVTLRRTPGGAAIIRDDGDAGGFESGK
jgi:hypothetical protein